jgi:hypothetical protein
MFIGNKGKVEIYEVLDNWMAAVMVSVPVNGILEVIGFTQQYGIWNQTLYVIDLIGGNYRQVRNFTGWDRLVMATVDDRVVVGTIKDTHIGQGIFLSSYTFTVFETKTDGTTV